MHLLFYVQNLFALVWICLYKVLRGKYKCSLSFSVAWRRNATRNDDNYCTKCDETRSPMAPESAHRKRLITIITITIAGGRAHPRWEQLPGFPACPTTLNTKRSLLPMSMTVNGARVSLNQTRTNRLSKQSVLPFQIQFSRIIFKCENV